jgi:uncharacterized FlgJ-related protein
MADISLRDVAKYYNNQEHQNFALDFLQDQIPPGTLAKFSDLWRSGPKNNIPSNGSWDGVVELATKAGSKYPELVAAQWALESNWGKQPSGRHNYFGLKGTGTNKPTTEYVNGKPVTITDSFLDFGSLNESITYLVERWYKDYKSFRGVNNAKTVNEAAKMLVQQGYATDPAYADKLISLVTRETNKTEVAAKQVLLKVPYEYQLDNKSGAGYRECFSSSCAMVAEYYGKVKTDDEYNAIRQRYGDSTDVNAQLKTLKHLGLDAKFIRNGSQELLQDELDAGRPVVAGWLHKGPVGDPGGSGHYSVVIGYTSTAWIHHDPNGEADMVRGGYVNHTNGKGIAYSKKNWNKRWMVEGPGFGWAILIKKPG